MTKRIYIPVILLMIIATVGCKKYVDKGLPDTFDDSNFWRTEDNVRVYSWPFYEMFLGYGNKGSFGDFYFTSLSDDQAAPSIQQLTLNIPTGNSKWDFSYVRKANILLERVDRVQMDDASKNHWRGVARFFRALSYFNMVKEFGDVPWMGHSMDISDSGYIYKGRDPRTQVMDSVLNDLDYAITNLRVKDQDNTINQYVALALKSRVCLFEGTWRKYHTKDALPGADKFLLAAKDAAEKLINDGPFKLNDVYTTTYNSLDLSNNKEVMLCKKYVPSYLTHSLIGYLTSSTTMSGFTKNAIESFVCSDGLPIKLSPLYQGDADIQHTRANRDQRLLQSVDTVLCYVYNLKDGRQSSTGYRPTKFLNPAVANIVAPNNDTDAPLFWLAEVLLNYAEAAAELNNLGKYAFSQTDLDKSINKLRKRAGIPDLQFIDEQHVATNGVAFTDPANNHGVSSLIWEIRRERRVELMLDGFRYYDLLRWMQGDKLTTTTNPDITKGAKVPASTDPAKVVPRDANGYLQVYTTGASRVFAEKNYLQPIPSGQISLYPPGKLTQNPGWQ
ncbi:RagB/SusD family nutrient uptake outer membrane protein [Chitinophaga qingshengii]|uniref:RagB/SusD family nutrient uptake outer membrane protein n=1 Tax=Chitinophaga qingshengii TaxID=1569794 RepID=A0ABR7THW9_9BACT|nr:RagB/SusD family nutrient uptake outer membrane protein [Chitinophaga qingshengii]MBC9930096.1 RagB/SusD family nutrient uptake outer membrane protein [Chitinophaga qingshengii]